ncbi:hypothetical protein SPRG_07318 [Saprolegnia parasitica CBS 223.65]|uniref:L-asparaginase N-terminal domain-containing protein n=1 Tax=Saprolegnia parasitica (strain CBS 223.65) TaxID=695850 RepID=A0A067CAD5_SAPPC|nr:hypothetical protein SPRG_07318 [Saprolegnia parasitica CBS 223.65]KDO27689.1 hypothetical protein SPRG_07318 [Saprolegnia parasitica CBS 223.65]|eukprot:XP_012201498.1 hypothetical protein SPRG_07318 [Saprolegnia parasitica CBS 223.65]
MTDEALRRYNFGRASSRCELVYGAERPGYVHLTRDQPATPRGPDVDDAIVQKWIGFMQAAGIGHVLCLLTKEELRFYARPLLESLGASFGDAHVTHVDVASAWQLATLLSCLARAVNANEKIVVFCSTGQSRTANVLALWLHRQHALGIAEAINDVVAFAQEARTTRKPRVPDVIQLLLGHGSSTETSSTPPPPPPSARLNSSRPNSSRLASSSSIGLGDESVDWCFLHMGGALDRRSVSTGRFGEKTQLEIGDSCVRQILSVGHYSRGYEAISVCKREGADITLADRKALLAALFRTSASHVVVTHGLETLLESARYVQQNLPTLPKVVVFTGATLPATETASDATFALGFAVGVCSTLRHGVYIAVHGRVMSAASCLRNERTGFFEELRKSNTTA